MLSDVKNKILLWGQKKIERGAYFLAPISFVWGFVSFCKNKLYDLGWLPVEKVDGVVVSVGNIVAGGSGKTPLVHLLSSRFPSLKIAILSRGYGKIPDEAILLERKLKNAKIYIGKDRVALAKRAVKEGCDLIILDDGFQYRKLHRDFDLVVLLGSDPLGKNHYLPWGFLRDSPKRLQKADALFVSGPLSIPFDLPHIPLTLKVEKITGEGFVLDLIAGLKVAMFCAIAKPHLFKKTIEGLGGEVVSEWVLADHAAPDERSLERFAKQAQKLGAEALLCTEKDFVKLDPSLKLSLPLYCIQIAFEVREEQNSWENLIAKIGQKIDNRAHDERN